MLSVVRDTWIIFALSIIVFLLLFLFRKNKFTIYHPVNIR